MSLDGQGKEQEEGPPKGTLFARGQLIAGKYEWERVLGQGGMGVVVAARHQQLGQRVALKFLRADGGQDATVRARFLREARLCVQLQSEHVARVLDVGTLEDGAPYMVMEYLHGHDLSVELRRVGPLDVATAVSYTLQACEALAEAHALGIIHRDLKPANLFLVHRRDGTRRLKVLDFGIAKWREPDEGLSLADSATMLGTPCYMSPEQLQSSSTLDERSDIWSLTMVLYELLTGTVAFPRRTMPELCAAILLASARAPQLLNPSVPAALSAVVLRGLEKDAARRYQSLGELAAALAPFAPDGEASAARVAHTLGLAPDSVRSAPLPVLSIGPSLRDTLAETGPNPALDTATSLAVSSTHRGRFTGRLSSRRTSVALVLVAAVLGTLSTVLPGLVPASRLVGWPAGSAVPLPTVSASASASMSSACQNDVRRTPAPSTGTTVDVLATSPR